MTVDTWPKVERRQATPIELRKLSNGPRNSLVGLMLMLAINVIALVAYIVKDHERQNMMEASFQSHVEEYDEFRKNVLEMKLDIREINTRLEFIGQELKTHRETEP